MFEKIYDLFGWILPQRHAFDNLIIVCRNLFADGLAPKRILASLMVIVELFISAIFKTPQPAMGQQLDLSNYELVIEDEFEGDELNLDIWEHRAEGARRSGFNAASQAKVKNGNLYLTGEYLENGAYGEGWYAGMIALKEHPCKGYFEIRCICSDSDDFWSAFWIQADHPYDHYLSDGGIGGAELDIFEAMSADAKLKSNREAVTSTIHCNGVDDDIENIDSRQVGTFKVKDLYTKYNTFGLEWTDDEYIFYINGVESARSSFGKGVSQVPEQVILSLEIPSGGIQQDKDYKKEFIVDYVRIYKQK